MKEKKRFRIKKAHWSLEPMRLQTTLPATLNMLFAGGLPFLLRLPLPSGRVLNPKIDFVLIAAPDLHNS